LPYSAKKFSFRLQTLLNIEENKERQAQQAFKKAIEEQRRQEAILEQQKEEMVRSQQAMLNDIQQGAAPQQLAAYDAYFHGLVEQMDAQQKRIAEAAQAAETARQHLAECSKKKKTLEKLKETALENYNDEVRKVENTLMDEIGSVMVARKGQ
jgi:flagellar FliJ protein